MLIACGGWSFRDTVFGNDLEGNRSINIIDPASGAAKIRAFFVNPQYACKGVGSILMNECEKEAIHMGYKRLELMTTLPGKHLYAKHGFLAGDPIDYSLNNDLSIEFVPMTKTLT